MQDNLSIVGARETYMELKGMCRILGAEQKLNVTEALVEHSFHQDIREPMYAWMNRWFGQGGEGSEEQHPRGTALMNSKRLWRHPSHSRDQRRQSWNFWMKHR